jgi:dienelactone hydrolase
MCNLTKYGGLGKGGFMRKMMRLLALSVVVLVLCFARLRAEPVRAYTSGEKPADARLQKLKDLNGYFPFAPPSTMKAWQERAKQVRQRILVSQGLWPMPTRAPMNAVIHGRIDRGEYSIEKVYFESSPGLYVTGNLYRPKNAAKKVPAVLFAHGHWQDARLSIQTPDKLRVEIATGEERFEKGGQSRFQSMCVQLARMGCVVWQWDMLSDSDAVQVPREVIHKFAKQRAEMNAAENWGLFSPQAESHLQSIMGLHTWNAIRSVDFVLSLPEVDPDRIAVTGASGGGTQTMILAAIDSRISLSFPAVMVSTAMQGGCTCENASLLRIGTGNVEFAALFAPKPQGMNTANDWTKELAVKGFPDLQTIYKLTGAPKNLLLNRGEHFPHNYNAVTRSAFYTWLNQHFKLGFASPVIEQDYEPLSRAELTVWDEQHPSPKANDPDTERAILQWLHTDAQQQLTKAIESPQSMQEILRIGIETVIGRTYEQAGDVEWKLSTKFDRGSAVEMTGVLRNRSHGEELPVHWFYPKNWNQKAVIWLTESGKHGLLGENDRAKPEVQRLVDAGFTVLGVDLFMQGEFLDQASEGVRNRVVDNPREFAGYTYGYNHALFAQRTHDVISLTRFLKLAKVGEQPNPASIALIALDQTGPIAAAARAVLGSNVDRTAIDTRGFRFGKLVDYRDSMFLPGGAKYLDLPGMLILNAPNPLWLAGEATGSQTHAWIEKAYAIQQQVDKIQFADNGHASDAVTWILSP